MTGTVRRGTATGSGFFRIDSRTWGEVCDRGMNAAVAYLVLACGTGGDNRTTAWSSEAVANYAGMAWVRGKPAIQELIRSWFVAQTKSGSRPRYELLDRSEVIQARLANAPALDGYSSLVFKEIATGKQPKSKSQRECADQLVKRGSLWICDGKYSAQSPSDGDSPAEHFIWLPKTLVTGTYAGEPSPLERVRRTRDVLTLRLLVDLYRAQHLRDDGGVSRSVVYQKFERTRVGEQGIYVVWSFSPVQSFVVDHPITKPHWDKQPDGRLAFWTRMDQLLEQGLIEYIPYLCEADAQDAELIHPYGTDWTETGLQTLENAVGRAAYCAGLELGRKPDVYKCHYLAPVPRDFPHVSMVGIARLRYRPHTKLTSQWWALLQAHLPEWIARYDKMRSSSTQSETSRGINGCQGSSTVFKGVSISR